MPKFLSPLDLFAPVYREPVALTDAPVIALDASLGNLFAVTLGGNRELGTPANPKAFQMIMLAATQDSGGSRTLSYSPAWVFSTLLPQQPLSTLPGKTDYLLFICSGDATKWQLLGFMPGA